MFDMKFYILKHFNKIKVIHSIPGRIRMKIPTMKNVPNECRHYDEFVIKGIKILDGVDEVSFNYILGTALITYDTHKIYEEKIISWINKIVEITIKNLDFIQKYGENNLDYVIDTVEQQLQDEVRRV